MDKTTFGKRKNRDKIIKNIIENNYVNKMFKKLGQGGVKSHATRRCCEAVCVQKLCFIICVVFSLLVCCKKNIIKVQIRNKYTSMFFWGKFYIFNQEILLQYSLIFGVRGEFQYFFFNFVQRLGYYILSLAANIACFS